MTAKPLQQRDGNAQVLSPSSSKKSSVLTTKSASSSVTSIQESISKLGCLKLATCNTSILPPSSHSKEEKYTSRKEFNSIPKRNYKKVIDEFPILSSAHNSVKSNTNKTSTSIDFFDTFPNEFKNPSSPPSSISQDVNDSFASTITTSSKAPSPAVLSSFSKKSNNSTHSKVNELMSQNVKLKEERLSLLQELSQYSNTTDQGNKDQFSFDSNELLLIASPGSKDSHTAPGSSALISPQSNLSFFSDFNENFTIPFTGSKDRDDAKLGAIHALKQMTHKQTQNITNLKSKVDFCKKALEEKDASLSELENLLKQSRKETFMLTRKMKSQEKELESVRRELIASLEIVDEMTFQKKEDEKTISVFREDAEMKRKMEYELELSKRNFLECSELLGEKEMEAEDFQSKLEDSQSKVKELEQSIQTVRQNALRDISSDIDLKIESSTVDNVEKDICLSNLIETLDTLHVQSDEITELQKIIEGKESEIIDVQSQINNIKEERKRWENQILILEKSVKSQERLFFKSQDEQLLLKSEACILDEYNLISHQCHLHTFLIMQEHPLTINELKENISESNESMIEDISTLREALSNQQEHILELQTTNMSLSNQLTVTKQSTSSKLSTMEKECDKLRTWARKALEQVKRLEKDNQTCKATIRTLQKQQQLQQNHQFIHAIPNNDQSSLSGKNSVRSTSPLTITGETTSEMNTFNMPINDASSVASGTSSSIPDNSRLNSMDNSRHSTTSFDDNSTKLEYLQHSNHSNTGSQSDRISSLEAKNILLEKELSKFRTAASTIRSELLRTQTQSKAQSQQFRLEIEKLSKEKDAYEIKIAALENQFYEWNSKKQEELKESNNSKMLKRKIEILEKQLARLDPNFEKNKDVDAEVEAKNSQQILEYQEMIETLESEIILLQENSENIIETLRSDISNLVREKNIITTEKNRQLHFLNEERQEIEEDYLKKIEHLEDVIEDFKANCKCGVASKIQNGKKGNRKSIAQEKEERENELRKIIQEKDETIKFLRNSLKGYE